MEYLESSTQFHQLLQSESFFVIYKHSPACSVCIFSLSHVNEYLREHEDILFWQIDILEQRGLSDSIAKHLQVQHESPQLLLIRKEKVVAHASHFAVTGEWIGYNIQKYTSKEEPMPVTT